MLKKILVLMCFVITTNATKAADDLMAVFFPQACMHSSNKGVELLLYSKRKLNRQLIERKTRCSIKCLPENRLAFSVSIGKKVHRSYENIGFYPETQTCSNPRIIQLDDFTLKVILDFMAKGNALNQDVQILNRPLPCTFNEQAK